MVSNKNISAYTIALIVGLALVVFACKKTPREPSKVYVPPVYPSVFTSMPCYSEFSRSGSYVYNKRMVLKANSGAISSWPMLTYYDSTSVNMYTTPTGLTAISFNNKNLNDSFTFYFKYLDFTRKLRYDIKTIDPQNPGNMGFNEVYAEGWGYFTRFSASTLTSFAYLTSGYIYVGTDAATGKKEIVLCNCSGKMSYFSNEENAVFEGRFTIDK